MGGCCVLQKAEIKGFYDKHTHKKKSFFLAFLFIPSSMLFKPETFTDHVTMNKTFHIMKYMYMNMREVVKANERLKSKRLKRYKVKY